MTNVSSKKPAPKVVAVRLSDDLQSYLAAKAKSGFRSVSREIAMRLEDSRKREQLEEASA